MVVVIGRCAGGDYGNAADAFVAIVVVLEVPGEAIRQLGETFQVLVVLAEFKSVVSAV